MAAKAEEATRSFWEGEWVCADCGYIYDIDDCGGLYLEEQVRRRRSPPPRDFFDLSHWDIGVELAEAVWAAVVALFGGTYVSLRDTFFFVARMY